MKKLTIFVIVIVLSFTIFFLVAPKKSFSLLENRTLESKPVFKVEDVINGKYMNKIENYISDHFPIKNTFLYIKTFIFRIIGFDEINDVYMGKDNYLIENYPEIDYKDELVTNLNDFKDKVNVSLKLMIVPTKSEVLKEKLPSNSKVVDEEKEISYICRNVNIDCIDILSALKEEKDNTQLFYKTDHHWTSMGAYFAYKEYIKDSIELNNLHLKEITNDFLGSTYSKTTNYNQEKDSIFIFEGTSNLEVEYTDKNVKTSSLYNFDYLDKKDKYSLFLDNNHDLIKIINNDVDDSYLLVIKDSFANSLIPLLINHYHEIDVIDPRYYKRSISKYISDNKIEEVLIIYNYGTLATDKNILSIR